MTKKTVLLVEDDEAFRYAAARHFERAGLRVIEAKDTFKALHLLEGGETADCLVVDIQMPSGMPHGLALANMVRARNSRQVIIFVTAFSDMAALTRQLWGGASVFAKPVDLDALTAEIMQKVEGVTTI